LLTLVTMLWFEWLWKRARRSIGRRVEEPGAYALSAATAMMATILCRESDLGVCRGLHAWTMAHLSRRVEGVAGGRHVRRMVVPRRDRPMDASDLLVVAMGGSLVLACTTDDHVAVRGVLMLVGAPS